MEAVTMIETTRGEALAKWHEYKDAFKKTKDKKYLDAQRVYNALKNGVKIVDVSDAIKKGGIHTGNCHPKLAICQAIAAKCFCTYSQTGSIQYRSTKWEQRAQATHINFPSNTLPPWKSSNNNQWASIDLSAPVPIIPPRLRPVKLTADYYILWEVDTWTPIPSKDPYLLRRIKGNLMAYCAGWDLTDLEVKIFS